MSHEHQLDTDDGPQQVPHSYTGVDDPKLLAVARDNLRHKHPSLTDDDIENLVGVEANRILNPNQQVSPD